MSNLESTRELAATDRAVPPSDSWWSEEYGFFGPFYLEGDDSLDGYLQARTQTLAERTATEVSGIVRLLSLGGGERILDVPCGYGRHSIGLASRGFSVVGADLNRTFLQIAEARAREAGADVQFVHRNMRALDFEGEFDAVVNMFYSFGFFATDAENLMTLAGFHRVLRPGGAMLMHTDVNVPRVLNGAYRAVERRRLRSGKVLRIIDTYNAATRRIDGTWILGEEGGVRKEYSVRVYTHDEFAAMCREVGFTEVTAYGDWDAQPYGESSEDMIIVARK